MTEREPIVLSFSGGKDSLLALHELRRDPRYEVTGLVTTISAGVERVGMHGVRRELLLRQAAAIGLPLDEVVIPTGATNTQYESALAGPLARYRAQGITAVAFGDIFLEDLRLYRERQLGAHGLGCVCPLWQRDTAQLARRFLELGFQAVTVCVDARVLDERFLGRELDDNFFTEQPPGVDPCGENGEFHSFVYAGPEMEQVDFSHGETVLRDGFLYCDLLPAVESTLAE